eukprot:2710831-Prymnesium_polylepis.2
MCARGSSDQCARKRVNWLPFGVSPNPYVAHTAVDKKHDLMSRDGGLSARANSAARYACKSRLSAAPFERLGREVEREERGANDQS